MTQQVQDERASPSTPPPTEPRAKTRLRQTLENTNESLDPFVKLMKNVKVIALALAAILTLLAAFASVVTPGGLMCVGLVTRLAAAPTGWDSCPHDDDNGPKEPDPDLGDITVAIDEEGRLFIAGAHSWMPRSLVALKLVDPNGHAVTLDKSVRTFRSNRHGSLGKRRGRVLWVPRPHHPRGSYTVIAKGFNPDGTKRREEATVNLR